MEQEHKELLFEVGIDTFVNLIDGAQQEVTICLVYCGLSLGKPEAGKDWAGTTKRRYYLDFGCENPHNTDAIPLISADILERELPELNWRRGHSGEKITLEQASKLHLLWLKYAFRKINGIV